MTAWRRRIAERLAGELGMELHYPPAREPETERSGTLANDGTPCAPWPDEGERYERRKALGRRDEYR